jgi:hypothetical protein
MPQLIVLIEMRQNNRASWLIIQDCIIKKQIHKCYMRYNTFNLYDDFTLLKMKYYESIK